MLRLRVLMLDPDPVGDVLQGVRSVKGSHQFFLGVSMSRGVAAVRDGDI